MVASLKCHIWYINIFFTGQSMLQNIPMKFDFLRSRNGKMKVTNV